MALATTRLNSFVVILTALLSALLSSAAESELGAQPGSPGERQPGAWVAHTSIAERVHRGSKTVVIKDCRGVKVGGRVRLSVGRAEEEEGSVAALHCPSPGGAHVPAALARFTLVSRYPRFTLDVEEEGQGARTLEEVGLGAGAGAAATVFVEGEEEEEDVEAETGEFD